MWGKLFRDCSITFVERHHGVYYSGEHVTGYINIILDEPKRVTDLIFQSNGISMCQWTRRSGKSSVRYSATVCHYRSSMSLLMRHTRDPEHHDTVLLEAGTHSFPFSLTLPEELPTTFESKIGHVRYTIKVTATRHLRMDEKYKMAFTVISKCDLNRIPKCSLSVTGKVRKSFNSFFIGQGAAQMTTRLPVSGFLPGQKIPITCSINNYSKIPIKEITYTFRRIITYTSERPRNMSIVHKNGLTQYVGQGVAKLSESVYKVSFPVPAVPPSTTLKNQPVTIEYDLKIVAVVMFHKNLVLHIPVIIGNIPLNSTSSQDEPCASGGDSQFNLPPPSYEACRESNGMSSAVSFNNQHNNFHYTPMYPVFNFPESDPQHGDVLEKRL